MRGEHLDLVGVFIVLASALTACGFSGDPARHEIHRTNATAVPVDVHKVYPADPYLPERDTRRLSPGETWDTQLI